MYLYKSTATPSDLILAEVLTRRKPLSITVMEGESDSEEDVQAVCVEDEFSHDGCLYRVTSIVNDSVEAICFYPKHVNPLFNRLRTFDDKYYVLEKIMDRL